MAMVPSLTSATVVCRAQPRLAPLKHVTAAVSSFLDYSAGWSIASACARGTASPDGDGVSLRLLERVAVHRAAAATRNSLASKRQRDDFYRQWEFTRAAAAAAARGDVQALKWLVDMFPNCRVTVAVEEAAKHGQLQILQELFFAGKHGHLHVAQWLHEHTAPPPTHMFFVTLEEAARNGDLEMVRWLCEVRGEWSPYAAVLAASGGHLEVLEWLRTNLFSSSSSSISMDNAASEDI
ncbi:Ankyrin repeat-containing domain [Phytophthora cactorum]|nr:Ankyrin repeat-containing domain [Phytophthora cactorum]